MEPDAIANGVIVPQLISCGFKQETDSTSMK